MDRADFGMTRARLWTRAETQALRSAVAARTPFRTIAADLDRTLNAVCVRASKLGLRQPDAAGHPARERFDAMRARSLSLPTCARVLGLTLYTTRKLDAERRDEARQETA